MVDDSRDGSTVAFPARSLIPAKDAFELSCWSIEFVGPGRVTWVLVPFFELSLVPRELLAFSWEALMREFAFCCCTALST